MRHLLHLTCFLLLASASCALTDSWDVDVRKHGAVERVYKQGESIDALVTLRSGFAPLDLTGARAVFYWYTNTVQNIWWTNSASVVSNLTALPWAMPSGPLATVGVGAAVCQLLVPSKSLNHPMGTFLEAGGGVRRRKKRG